MWQRLKADQRGVLFLEIKKIKIIVRCRYNMCIPQWPLACETCDTSNGTFMSLSRREALMVLSSSRCIRFQQDIVDNIPLWPGASVNGTFIKSLLAAAVLFDLHSVRRGSDRHADDLRSLITTHLIRSKKNGTSLDEMYEKLWHWALWRWRNRFGLWDNR